MQTKNYAKTLLFTASTPYTQYLQFLSSKQFNDEESEMDIFIKRRENNSSRGGGAQQILYLLLWEREYVVSKRDLYGNFEVKTNWLPLSTLGRTDNLCYLVSVYFVTADCKPSKNPRTYFQSVHQTAAFVHIPMEN